MRPNRICHVNVEATCFAVERAKQDVWAMRRRRHGLVLFSIYFAAEVSLAQPSPVVECVGRLQLTLPGDAEMAVASREYLEHQLSSFKRLNVSAPFPFQFADGSIAGFSHLQGIAVTAIGQSLDEQRIKALRTAYIKDRDEVADRQRRSSIKRSVERFALDPNGDASRTAWKGSAIVEIGDRVVLLGTDADRSLSDQQQSKRIAAALRAVVKQLAVRPFGSVPKVPGLCLPYSFLIDGGASYRDIAVTYRLREHPDVTVFLKDSVAAKPDSDQGSRAKLAQYRIDDFWSQYASGMTGLKSVWSPAYRSFSFGNQSGLKSFVRFVRQDGMEDFGFAASVPGNANAKTDEPDLMLYVVRDAQAAKSKGITPIDMDAFLGMAEDVATSIRFRP
jgi:hypothetical protein